MTQGMMAEEKRIADYFVLAGLPLHGPRVNLEDARDGSFSPSFFSQCNSPLDPITDITVIIRSEGEVIPFGYSCIEATARGHPADLNHGSFRMPNIFLCYRRGRDKPPLVDIGVMYEGKEKPMAEVEVVDKTLLGRSANVNNGSSRIFLTCRRAQPNGPANQLVVTDICVIFANKGEQPPRAYCKIGKNLNKGVLGSEIYLCYKKSMNQPPLIRFQPSILSRFPTENYAGYPLPESVPMFCLPMGATIECWNRRCRDPQPVFSSFVLTSDTAVKVYGAAITFYESFPQEELSPEEKVMVQYESHETQKIVCMKSICIISKWPFFSSFEGVLNFLHNVVTKSAMDPLRVPVEKIISHFMLEVPFPSRQRPNIQFQMDNYCEATLMLSQPPEDIALPLNGAAFFQVLRSLGVDSLITLFTLALAEQKILLHSLRPDVLTGAAEAISCLIFPFVWQCPYIPICPLGLCDVLNAPLPFIVGVDSRYFDLFVPPTDLICVDLDTCAIYVPDSKADIHLRILPKNPLKILRQTLDRIQEKICRPPSSSAVYLGQKGKSNSISDDSVKKFERGIDIEIQEAFLKFMSSCFKGFRSFLKPITKASSAANSGLDTGQLFDINGFLASRDRKHSFFYELMVRTQMFSRFIEERSFSADKQSCLAFFDECLEKVESNPNYETTTDLKLIDHDDYLKDERTVFIPGPEPNNEKDCFIYTHFGPLNIELFHAQPVMTDPVGTDANGLSWLNLDAMSPTRKPSIKHSNSSCRRTKQEMRLGQRIAHRHRDNPYSWCRFLVSQVYGLWFIHLPSYVKAIKDSPDQEKSKDPLRTGLEVLIRMQSLNLFPKDEICYRILMLLCGEYSHPVLAVKVLCEMKEHGVIPNAITYGYYNKAILDSEWPVSDTNAHLLWAKLRNVVLGVNAFKTYGTRKKTPSCRRALQFSEIPEQEAHLEEPDSRNGMTSQQQMLNGTDVLIPSLSSTGGESGGKHDLGYFSELTSISGSSMLKGDGEDSPSINPPHPLVHLGKEQSSEPSREEDVIKQGSPNTSATGEDEVFTSSSDKESLSPKHSDEVIKDEMDVPVNENAPVPPHHPPTASKPYIRSLSQGNEGTKPTPSKGPTLKPAMPPPHLRKEASLQETIRDRKVSIGCIPSENPFTEKSLTMPESLRKFHASAKAARSSSVDGWFKGKERLMSSDNGTMSPIKDMISNLGIFSPDGKVAITIKNGIKIARDTMGDSPTKMSRSSTIGSNMSTESTDMSVPLMSPGIPRSATLPSEVSEGGPHTPSTRNSQTEPQTPDNPLGPNSMINQTTPSSSVFTFKTPTMKSKNFEFFSSSIKSAKNSMASRISEIKQNLSSNSPAKTPGGSSLLSTMASALDKISGYGGDDDDSSSLNSFNDRKMSSAYSDDDLSERSREGSLFRGFKESFKFDMFERKHYGPNNRLGERLGTPIVTIEMTSSCRCGACMSIVFDEEIMFGWSADDSNLNTKCIHCEITFVPLLTITLVNNVSPQNRHDPFTFPYLSPIVLRKEVENVIEHEGDTSFLETTFIEAHPIIYWNMIWYFERVNMPSVLPGLALHSKLFGDSDFSSLDYRNVDVKCYWDNERLFDEAMAPMCVTWANKGTTTSSPHQSPTGVRKREFKLRDIEIILNNLRQNMMQESLELLIQSRKKMLPVGDKMSLFSMYRDLLFLLFSELGRDNIDHVAFDCEYRKTVDEILMENSFRNVFILSDKPPPFESGLCRRSFQRLHLKMVDEPSKIT